MDTSKIIIYIAIGAAYYGYRYFVKNFGTSKTSPSKPKPIYTEVNKREEERSLESVPEMSFSDFIEDIKKKEVQNKQPNPAPRFSDPRSLENTDYELEPQNVIIKDVNPYLYSVPKLSTTTKKSADLEKEALKKKPHPILASLKDRKKLKEAFILSEILAKRF